MAMSEQDGALHVEALKVTAGEKQILQGIGFTLQSNDVLGLIGETGAGKSVLIEALGMNLATGLSLSAKELRYQLGGHPVQLHQKTRDELQASIWGKSLTFIPSNARSRFNPIMTVGEQFINILQSNMSISDKEAREKAHEMFMLVHMPDPKRNLDNYPHELSGGMIQRVEIAIALAMRPKFLLADEPTMGLDVTVQRQILDLMEGLFRQTNACVVLATRDLGIAANYCNKIAVLHKGRMVELNTVKEFFKNPQHPYSQYLLDIAFVSNEKNPAQRARFVMAEGEEG